jgi:hypothetical protein
VIAQVVTLPTLSLTAWSRRSGPIVLRKHYGRRMNAGGRMCDTSIFGMVHLKGAVDGRSGWLNG